MTAFTLSLVTLTPVVIGQWLTLDALLDGMMEADGLEPDERVVPLLSWDGKTMHSGVSTSKMASDGLVHVASAMMPYGAFVGAGEDKVFQSRRPRVIERVWRRGVRTATDFPDGQMPFVDGRGKDADKFDIKRGPGASILQTIRCLAPGKVEWVAQGDPDRVVSILRDTLGAGIGAKTRAGMGSFDRDSIVVEEMASSDIHPLTGILDPGGKTLWRPVPQSMLDQAGILSRQAMQTCRSPYWDRSTQEPAFVPFARHHDGILTI